MDVDFIVQDTFALVRPQWKLATNLDEAGRAFADAVAQNYKTQEAATKVTTRHRLRMQSGMTGSEYPTQTPRNNSLPATILTLMFVLPRPCSAALL